MKAECKEQRAEGQKAGRRSGSGPPPSALRPPLRRGLTLIELLVVIIILTTLVSAAIPIMAPSNDDRRLREASRNVNSYISAAQMKAVQLQRPFGVALKRLSQDTKSPEDNGVCLELFYVEQPAPYRGFDRTSAAMVARHPDRAGWVLVQFVVRGTSPTSDSLPVGWDADLVPPGLIRAGDVIEINGTRYALKDPRELNSGESSVVPNNTTGTLDPPASGFVRVEAEPQNDTGQMLSVQFDNDGWKLKDPLTLKATVMPSGAANRPAPFWTSPSPYKILRQPVPASGEPMQLPEGTAIDLRASGQAIEFQGSGSSTTASGFFQNPDLAVANNRVNNSFPIVIMFTPEGAIERIRLNTENAVINETQEVYDGRTVSNIYLLIGRRQNAPPPELAVDKTLDLSSYTPPPTEQQKQEYKDEVNWLRGESRWIVIGSQSGRVVTVDNAFVDPPALMSEFSTETAPDIRRARQIHASREFAREMVQAGGR